MVITLKTENLMRGLNVVSGTTKSDPNLPILSHILLESRQGRLRLSSTDLDTGSNTLVRARVDQDGSIAVPAKTFVSFLNSVSSEELTLETEGNNLLLKSDDGQAKFTGMSGEDFPFQYSLIKKIKSNFFLSVPAEILKNRLTKTAGSAAKDDSRPEIAGVLWWLKGKSLTLVATDSYRLSENIFEVSKSSLEEVKMIMPAVSCLALARVIAGEEVKVYYSDNQVLFEFEDNIFTARLSEGNYPEYKQIIPENLETKVVVKKGELAAAIKRSSIFVGPMSNAITLLVDDVNQQISVAITGGNLGSSESKVPTLEFKGSTQEVAYNWQYLLEGLANINGDKIVLETSGATKPAILHSTNQDGFIYLIMPIRS